MPVPLLRFPYVALKEVFKHIGVKQLFPLSLCSRRMHLVVKNLRDKSIELNLSLYGYAEASTKEGATISFVLREKKKKGLHQLFSLRVREMPNHRVPKYWHAARNFFSHVAKVIRSKVRWLRARIGVPDDRLKTWTVEKYRGAVFFENEYRFISCWEDMGKGTRCMLEHLCDLFGVQVERVSFHKDQLWILDMVEALHGPRSYDADAGPDLTDEQVRHLLFDLNPKSLFLQKRPSDQFSIENFHKSYDTLYILFGNWVTGENLLTLDCSRLVAEAVTITAATINRFLRHVLIEGGAPRLTEFRAWVERPHENEVLDGIREVLAPIPGRDHFESNDRFWTFRGMWVREGKSLFVSIKCEKWLNVCLKIREEDDVD